MRQLHDNGYVLFRFLRVLCVTFDADAYALHWVLVST